VVLFIHRRRDEVSEVTLRADDEMGACCAFPINSSKIDVSVHISRKVNSYQFESITKGESAPSHLTVIALFESEPIN